MATGDAHAPIDTSVRVPDAVRAMGAAADALLAGTPPAGPPPAPTPVAPLGAAPPPAGTNAPAPAPQPIAQPAPQPALQAHDMSPAGDPAAAQPGTLEAQWEQRFRTLRGRWDVQVATHQREISALQGQVNDLVRQVEAGGRPTPTLNGAPVALEVTPEERAEYEKTWGAEMTAFVLDVAGKLAGRASAGVVQQVGQTVQQTREEMTARAIESMKASLDQMLPGGNGHPDWRVVNDDPAFISWLQQADGFSKLSRLQVLLAAWNEADTQAVYRIFGAYMGTQPPQAGQGPGPLAPLNPPIGGIPQPSSRLPLTSLAAPGPARPATAGTPSAQEPNQYTVSQIAQFSQDKGRGVYNDTAARRAWAEAIEADIFAAQREGRVLQG